MKVILIKDDGSKIVSKNFIVAFKSQNEDEKDIVAVQGLTQQDILAATEIVLSQLQSDAGLPDPPKLCDECTAKMNSEDCTCGLNIDEILKEKYNDN